MSIERRVLREEVIPDLPIRQTPRAHICVLGSLNYPDINPADVELIRRFTPVALTTLIELGASYERSGTPGPRSKIPPMQPRSTVCCCSAAVTSTATATASPLRTRPCTVSTLVRTELHWPPSRRQRPPVARSSGFAADLNCSTWREGAPSSPTSSTTRCTTVRRRAGVRRRIDRHRPRNPAVVDSGHRPGDRQIGPSPGRRRYRPRAGGRGQCLGRDRRGRRRPRPLLSRSPVASRGRRRAAVGRSATPSVTFVSRKDRTMNQHFTDQPDVSPRFCDVVERLHRQVQPQRGAASARRLDMRRRAPSAHPARRPGPLA
jgi:hypothetical protein